jgi:hypothetical protein
LWWLFAVLDLAMAVHDWLYEVDLSGAEEDTEGCIIEDQIISTLLFKTLEMCPSGQNVSE